MVRTLISGISQFAAGAVVCVGAVVFSTASAADIATALVDVREVSQTYAAEGVVEAVRQSTVAAQVSGRVVELRVDAGQAVVRGQVLARIDAREAEQAVAASEALSARAEADLANARVTYERNKRLLEQKFISQAALDKALADYKAAQAQGAAARAGALQAGAAKSHAVITAPFSGVVAARHIELGEMAAPGRPILTLYDPKDLRVVASIPQQRLGEVRALAAAIVELPSIDQRVKGKTVTVLPSADARTHTTMVRVDLPRGLQSITPGMFARANFAIGQVKRLLIPASAIVYRSEVSGAYVVGDKGEIQFRQLRLGEAAGAAGVEVLSGVARGERVALDPVAALAQLKRGTR